MNNIKAPVTLEYGKREPVMLLPGIEANSSHSDTDLDQWEEMQEDLAADFVR